jgi:hypothetical protein
MLVVLRLAPCIRESMGAAGQRRQIQQMRQRAELEALVLMRPDIPLVMSLVISSCRICSGGGLAFSLKVCWNQHICKPEICVEYPGKRKCCRQSESLL